jgi:hypothetical protein
VNERLREALRRTVAAHNRLVRLSTVSSSIAVIFMWVAIYFIARWLTLLGSTVVKGLDAATPQHFDRVFGIVVVIWLIVGWIVRQQGVWQRAPVDKGAGLVLLEVFFAPTRATFAVLHNMQNRIRFSENDLQAATDFLVRVVRAGKLATTAVPVELPDEDTRERVLHALQLLDLIYLRQTDRQAWFAVANPQRLLAFL